MLILVRPQLADNIGMVARAMANFGLEHLRLVEPRDGWPNEKARIAASGANFIIDGAEAFAGFEAALAGLNWVCATTARQRDLAKAVLTPEQAVEEMLAALGQGQRCGIVFGPERNGLETGEVANADAVVMAPVNPNFASLNLAQAVLLLSYEWMKQAGGGHAGAGDHLRGADRAGPAARAARRRRAGKRCRASSSTWRRSSTPAASSRRRKSGRASSRTCAPCSSAWGRRSRKSAPCGESSRPWRIPADRALPRHSYASFSAERCAHFHQICAVGKGPSKRTHGSGIDQKGLEHNRQIRRRRLGLALAATVVMFDGDPAKAQNKELSEKSVALLMQYAWALTPPKFTAPDGKTIEVDKSKPKEVIVPLDIAREVIKVARLTAYAQLCELPEEQRANYQTLMRREEAKASWTQQQLLYINQLHLFTVMTLTGKVAIVDGKEGDKQVVVQDKKAATAASCTDTERERVKAQICGLHQLRTACGKDRRAGQGGHAEEVVSAFSSLARVDAG